MALYLLLPRDHWLRLTAERRAQGESDPVARVLQRGKREYSLQGSDKRRLSRARGSEPRQSIRAGPRPWEEAQGCRRSGSGGRPGWSGSRPKDMPPPTGTLRGCPCRSGGPR